MMIMPMNERCSIGPNFGEYTDIVKKMIREIERREYYVKARGGFAELGVDTITIRKDKHGSVFRISGMAVTGIGKTRSAPYEIDDCFSVDGDGNVKSIECSVESIDWIELRPMPEAELRAMHEREAEKTKEWLESPWGGGF